MQRNKDIISPTVPLGLVSIGVIRTAGLKPVANICHPDGILIVNIIFANTSSKGGNKHHVS
ncbi:MAG: hypothetical protein PHY48_06980 [Candidatus Cloacimonetes bacterium]|nr:hypothetical protein [Candidatus Cloacimonadota bacterium]